MQTRKTNLLQLIDEKLTEAKSAKEAKTDPGQHKADAVKPPRGPARKDVVPNQQASTRAESNRANARKSTGPKSPAGKQRASANSLKHGFFASVEKLNPHDAPAYQSTLADLRIGLQPDGPVEEQLLRELAMFTTRLQRLEAAEYALLAGNTESDPTDAREIAAAFERAAPALEQLHKIEIHLRRAYNRTWDRLQSIQKERHKLPLDESLKRSQVWLTYYAEKEKQAQETRSQPPKATPQPTFVVRDQVKRTVRPEAAPKVSSVVRDQVKRTGPDETTSSPSSVVSNQAIPNHPLFRPKETHPKPGIPYEFHDDEPDWKHIHPK